MWGTFQVLVPRSLVGVTVKSCPSTWLSAKVALAHLFQGALPPFLTLQSVLHTEARDISVKLESAQNRPPHPLHLGLSPFWSGFWPPLSPCLVRAMSQHSGPFLPHRYVKLRTHRRPLALFLFCQHGYSRLFQAQFQHWSPFPPPRRRQISQVLWGEVPQKPALPSLSRSEAVPSRP